MGDWQAYVEDQKGRFIEDFKAFLRIPSISTVSEHKPDIDEAAQWLAEHMKSIGIENVEVSPTDRHPIVYGEWLHAEGARTVLVYAHYDVQPADPLELWETPPFEPTIRDGRIYARGAADTKGNVLLALHACEAHLKTSGKLPVNVKFVIEGEEEIGSPSLGKWMHDHKEKLRCDVAANADSGQVNKDTPTVIVGAKGMCGVNIDVRTHTVDLHSGVMGGTVQNALHVISDIVSSMQGTSRRVAVDGFYKDVVPPTEEERAMCSQSPTNHGFAETFGLAQLMSEPGFTPFETMWSRPTLDVNGIWGGYQGEGAKTVIPCEAHAKVTCRLVANQDPDAIIAALTKHVQKHTPPGVEVTVTPIDGKADPYVLPFRHPALKAAERALEDVMRRKVQHERTGGTVPVLAMLKNELGVDVVSMGFFEMSDKIHAPNESVDLELHLAGTRVYARYFERLAD